MILLQGWLMCRDKITANTVESQIAGMTDVKATRFLPPSRFSSTAKAVRCSPLASLWLCVSFSCFSLVTCIPFVTSVRAGTMFDFRVGPSGLYKSSSTSQAEDSLWVRVKPVGAAHGCGRLQYTCLADLRGGGREVSLSDCGDAVLGGNAPTPPMAAGAAGRGQRAGGYRCQDFFLQSRKSSKLI